MDCFPGPPGSLGHSKVPRRPQCSLLAATGEGRSREGSRNLRGPHKSRGDRAGGAVRRQPLARTQSPGRPRRLRARRRVGPSLRTRGLRGRGPCPPPSACKSKHPPETKAGPLPKGKQWAVLLFCPLPTPAYGGPCLIWGPRGPGGYYTPTTPARDQSTAHARSGRRRPRPPAQPRSGPVALATGSRGEGPAAAAAISAASCSSRPRRHGNGAPLPGRFPARLARVTPAARAPSSLTCRFPLSPHGRRRRLLLHPGPTQHTRRPPSLPVLPVPTSRGGRGRAGERDGGRLLKNTVAAFVFLS